MKKKIENRKIVVVNQAVNYLTIGLCNAFAERFEAVALVTGSIHQQGEALQPLVEVSRINHWQERPAWKKMLSYLIACLRIYWLLLTRYRRYEVFFVSIPPMAYLLNLLLPHRFSMLIWDVYPDVFKITGMQEDHWLYRTWARLNRSSFAKAYRLFTISERMADLLTVYVPREKIIIQPIWSIFQHNDRIPKAENAFIHEHGLEGQFIVQYSGNIGLTHRVELMIELAELLVDEKDILFQIIGRGPRKQILQQMVKEKALPNCTFMPFQTDDMFPYSLSAADLGVVILDERTAKGSVPSKSYNLMSYGIPSLYIASPDAQLKLYADHYEHAACYSSGQLAAAAAFILKVKENADLQKRLSGNALRAAGDFKRGNADKFVSLYLGEPIEIPAGKNSV